MILMLAEAHDKMMSSFLKCCNKKKFNFIFTVRQSIVVAVGIYSSV